jgi:acyl carrier protein
MAKITARTFMLEKLSVLTGQTTADQNFLDAKLGSTGLDSLDLMELFNEVEEAFDIRIEDDSISADTTVQQMIDFIEAKAGAKSQASPR